MQNKTTMVTYLYTMALIIGQSNRVSPLQSPVLQTRRMHLPHSSMLLRGRLREVFEFFDGWED